LIHDSDHRIRPAGHSSLADVVAGIVQGLLHSAAGVTGIDCAGHDHLRTGCAGAALGAASCSLVVDRYDLRNRLADAVDCVGPGHRRWVVEERNSCGLECRCVGHQVDKRLGVVDQCMRPPTRCLRRGYSRSRWMVYDSDRN